MLNIPNRKIPFSMTSPNLAEEIKMLNSIFDILKLTDQYYCYLADKKIDFSPEGFPIFARQMFLDEWPELVIPYSQRKNKLVRTPEKTLICFFDADKHLYPRLEKVLNDIPEYRKYVGVSFLDITVTEDMDYEWQKIIALLNCLFAAVLAVNGVKLVFNTRYAKLLQNEKSEVVPQGVMCISGFLGCDTILADDYNYIGKILFMLPSKLLIYGKHDAVAEAQLDRMGISYRQVKDFHRLYKEEFYGR